MTLVASFAPVVSATAGVLVLGSMPGAESLRLGQYYANPRNQFWDLMGEICGAVRALPYEQRLGKLLKAGIALWDVLQYCQREGSLDSSIVAASEAPNDLRGLFDAYPAITTVCFNGKKAEKSFHRHVTPALAPAQCDAIRLVVLPSTSPAHAAMSQREKLSHWRAALRD